ncbi:universal stress protein [Saccharospirillum mangrovi]|uniref:universal stress protein n=1 Tax=Saccharospirillum mangrovi TaxID=2161747 RepID=UPI000D37CEDF|nr:universal stress protein [Saccharospirillum mangrovi]
MANDNNNKNLTGNILTCIDASKFSGAVCDYAVWMHQRIGAPVLLLHNLEQGPMIVPNDYSGTIGLGSRETLMQELTDIEAERSRLLLEQGKLMLSAARDRLQQAGVAEPQLKQRHGGLTESLIELEDDIRVLVLGIRGEERGDDDRHLGGHLESILRSLHKPVLVVNSEFTEPKRVMLAYDGSDASGKALDMLATRPLFNGLEIHLVTVGEDPGTAQSLQQAATLKLRDAGHNVTAVTLGGKPSEELVRYQADHDIDLTLMGAFSHTRLRDLVLGSLTVKMLLRANKPLLLLR